MPDYDLPSPAPTSIRWVWIDGRLVDVASEVLPLAAAMFSRPELANPAGDPPEMQSIPNLCQWMGLDTIETAALTEGLVGINDFWTGLPALRKSGKFSGLTIYCAERFDTRGRDSALAQTIHWLMKHDGAPVPTVWILPPGS